MIFSDQLYPCAIVGLIFSFTGTVRQEAQRQTGLREHTIVRVLEEANKGLQGVPDPNPTDVAVTEDVELVGQTAYAGWVGVNFLPRKELRQKVHNPNAVAPAVSGGILDRRELRRELFVVGSPKPFCRMSPNPAVAPAPRTAERSA